MRLLANENFPGDAVTALREAGHDVAWVRTDAPGSNDQGVLARAQAEDRILVTFDKDFGELAFRTRLPATSGIILFRITSPSADAVARGPCRPSPAARTGLDTSPSSKTTASA